MQEKWHQDCHSDPPPYRSRLSSSPVHDVPLDDPLSITNPSDGPPSYQSLQQPPTPPPAYRQNQYNHPASEIDLHSFPDRSTILVIGACTRQGMYIIDRLLEQNYQVRGLVSNPREAAQTSKYFESKYDRDHYHPWIVPNMSRRGAFDVAVASCAGVVFVSSQPSPVAISKTITLARVKNALTAAMKEARMDRFVYCSPRPTPIHPASRTEAWTGQERADSPAPSRSFESSRSSFQQEASEVNRASVEVAIWDCVDGQRPSFTLDIGEYLFVSMFIVIRADSRTSDIAKQLRHSPRRRCSLKLVIAQSLPIAVEGRF